MGDFTIPFRVSLLATIGADATLKTLMGDPVRFSDYVPQDTLKPYGRLGDDLITDYGDKSDPGQEIYETFHIYDMSPVNRGQKSVNLIQARLYALFHEQQFSINGGQIYLARFASQKVVTDDGLNWHGISSYRFLLS